MQIVFRKAKSEDLKSIIGLLADDKLGSVREKLSSGIDQKYINAFKKIENDLNQYLLVGEFDKKIICTCHLTLIPSLTYIGSTRLQIEAVRVNKNHRGKKIGSKMINFAIEWGKDKGAKIIQLTANKQRNGSISFYKSIGFENSHEGLKMFIR